MGLELHGIVERNFAFEEFLQFGESNQLTVMNTCFEKKTMHHGTWVSVETGSGHPGRVIRVTFSPGHPGLTRFTIYPGLTRIGSREK